MQGVNDVIDHLAAKLSVPAAHLWAILVRQAQAEAIGNLVLIVLAVAFMLVFALNFRRLMDAVESESDTQGFMATGALTIGCIVFAVAAISVLVNGYQTVLYFVNPEYYAVSKILSALTGK